MKRKIRNVAIAAICGALALIGAPAASAATDVGNQCTGDEGAFTGSSATIVQLSSTSNPGSVSIPQAGVLTKWRVNVIPYPGGISEKLKVLRPVGGNSFTVVGESSTHPIVGGSNTFDTRISVQAGDRLGVTGSPAAIFCESISTPGDVFGFFEGDPSSGSTAAFTQESGAQVAVSAVLEPDVDNDGFGDETQDKCPQNAAFQIPCPVALLSTSSGTVGKGLVKVLVTSNIQAAVTVGGTVKLGKGKTATLSGGTQVVLPGTIATFTVLFTQKLKAKLKQLTPKQRLTLNLTATATNPVGAPSVSALSVKLKGQKKPKPKKAKGKAKGQA